MTSLPQPLPEGSALLNDPDPLIASVPGVFGFFPERSLVLCAFSAEGENLTNTRHDLHLDSRGRPTARWSRELCRFDSVLAGHGAAGLVAVLVDDRFDTADTAAELTRYRGVFRAVERAFSEVGGLSAGFVLREFSAGVPWFTGWEPRCRAGRPRPPAPFRGGLPPSGTLSDPLLTPVALRLAVYEGRQVLARRSDLVEALAPAAHCDDDVCRPRDPVVAPEPAGQRDARRVRLVLEVIRSGRAARLACEQTNALAEALSSVHARDVLLALALTDLRDEAERLWTRLTRGLTGRAGAAAATLLGHLHYLAGHGALAAVAIERALELDPEYHLARLLDGALRNGLRPSALAEVLEYSFGLGQDLGVGLPAQTRLPAGAVPRTRPDRLGRN